MYPNDDFPTADNNRIPSGEQASDVWTKQFAPAPGTTDPRITFYEMGRAAGRAEMELARDELANIDREKLLGRSRWLGIASMLLAAMGSFSVGRITAPAIGNVPAIGNLASTGVALDGPLPESAVPATESSTAWLPRNEPSQQDATSNAGEEPTRISSDWALQGWLFGIQERPAASESSVLIARQNVDWAGPIDQPPYPFTAIRPGNARGAQEHLPPAAPSSDRPATLQRSDLLDPQFDWNQWFHGSDG